MLKIRTTHYYSVSAGLKEAVGAPEGAEGRGLGITPAERGATPLGKALIFRGQ